MGRILFIRHAQASFGTGNYDQLSKLGYLQANKLGIHLLKEGIRFDKIYVGPAKRHKQTLEQVQSVYETSQIPFPTSIESSSFQEHRGAEVLRHLLPTLIETDDKIRTWKAEAAHDASLRRKNHLRTFDYFMPRWATGTLTVEHPTDFEDWISFRKRVDQGFTEILNQSRNGHTVGVFTSGGTMSAAVGYGLAMSDNARLAQLNTVVRNTAITEFIFDGDRLTMSSFNITPHLPVQERTLV